MMEAAIVSVRGGLEVCRRLTALSHRVFAFAQATHAIARRDGSLAYGLGVVVDEAAELDRFGVVFEGIGLNFGV